MAASNPLWNITVRIDGSRDVADPTAQEWANITSNQESLVIVGLTPQRQTVGLRQGAELYGSDPRDRRVVDSMLISTRGRVNNPQCSYCEAERGPYDFCISLAGWFDNACNNCKRHDKGSTCTVGNIYKDSKNVRKTQEKSYEKDDYISSRGRATKKPVSYKE